MTSKPKNTTERLAVFVALALLASCAQVDGGSPPAEAHYDFAPGIEVHRRLPPKPENSNQPGPVTLIHVDPERFELKLLLGAKDGGSRAADEWLEDFDLVGVINSSMYLPNERSTGLMLRDDHFNNPSLNPSFGGVLAFGARHDSIPSLQFVGTDCGGFDLERLKADYRCLVQNYRLLDCTGDAVTWKDRKAYSSAAIGLDHNGWLVFAHSDGPCLTSDFARWMALEDWNVSQAHFVEGGPEASLYFKHQDQTIRLIGSYQGTLPSLRFRPVPNVLGVVARDAEG